MQFILSHLRGIFYGWWIALGSTLGLFLHGGFYYYGFSTFFLPLEQEFGWSRALLAGILSISRIEGAFSGPIGGFLVDHFGPRRLMIFGTLLMGSGFIVLSRLHSLALFYLIFIVMIALGSDLGIRMPCIISTSNWFIKKRSVAIGLAISGIGLGGLVVPILGWLIEHYGWRTTAVIAGLAIWIVGVPLAFIIRHRPEQYGLLPDGQKPSRTLTPQQAAEEVMEEADLGSDLTPSQALRTSIFWLLAVAFGLRQLVISAVVVHQVPFLVGIGLSPELAATMLGMLGIITVPGRLCFGFLGDRLPKRYVAAGAISLQAIGCLILTNVHSWWQMILFLTTYPLGYGGGASLMWAIRGEYFGRKYFGTISGLLDLLQMFGIVAGPILAGLIYDITSSYGLTFLIFALCSLTSALIVIVLPSPKRRSAFK